MRENASKNAENADVGTKTGQYEKRCRMFAKKQLIVAPKELATESFRHLLAKR